MSAERAVQAAVFAALDGSAGLAAIVSGVFDGAPARAAFPYLVIGDGLASDWGHKTGRGREHRVALTAWDAGEAGAARLMTAMAAAGDAIEAMPRDIDGHRVASLVFLRSRVARTAAGPWAGLLEYRVRTLEV